MNDTTLTQLKIIVERAVRPVRASTLRKRQMREELLAHVCGVFEDESSSAADEQTALVQTQRRFGSPSAVTSQLQEAVPARDRLRLWWEGPPAETAMRSGLRVAGVIGVPAVLLLAALLCAAGTGIGWSVEEVSLHLGAILALPTYLFGLALLAGWMEQALYGPAGPARLKVALVGAGSCGFMFLICAGFAWRGLLAEWDILSAVLTVVWLTPIALFFPYALARSSADRRRYHEEWADLDIA